MRAVHESEIETREKGDIDAHFGAEDERHQCRERDIGNQFRSVVDFKRKEVRELCGVERTQSVGSRGYGVTEARCDRGKLEPFWNKMCAAVAI